MAVFLVVACSLLLIVFSSYAVQLLADARRRLPPGPWPLPVIGNLHQLDHLPHRSLARLAARHGPLMFLRLGAVPAVVVSSPAMAREVLQRHNADIAARSIGDSMRAAGHCDNSVLCLPPRARWRALRRLAAELFSPRRLDGDAMRSLRREKVAELIGGVSESAARGAAVDVGAAAHAAALGVLSRAMFSGDLDAASSREVGEIVGEASVLAAGPNVSDFFPAVAAADLQGVRRRMARLVKRMYAVIDKQIELRTRSRAAGEHPKNDLLDAMLDKVAEVEEDGADINRDVIRGLFTDLFTGGEITSHTIECAMAELLQSPSSMRALQDELQRVIGGTKRQLDESDIANLPYLQAVVKETLRLHPPVPLPPYEAEAAVEVGGYTIPKGTKVLVNIWAIHRCGGAWPEPERFAPERFLGTGGDVDFLGRDFELIPFGSGRRACLGLPLAQRMLHLVLGSLLHRFRWTLPEEVERDGVDMGERFGLALSLVVPLRVIPREINAVN